MNILYYCDEYPPVKNGGIGTVVKMMAEAMAARGHGVVVAGRYWNGQGKETVEHINGVAVVRWHKGSYDTLHMKFYNLVHNQNTGRQKAQYLVSRTHRLIEEVVSKYAIDIVEMPDYVDDFMHNDDLQVENLRFSVPTLIRVHGSVSFLYYYQKGCVNEAKVREDRTHFRRADAICAVSAFSKDYVKEFLCDDKEVDVIYNPIDDSLFENVVGETGTQTILFFGKIAEMKGVASLIKAFNLVAKKHAHVKLRLIGKGDTHKAKCWVDPEVADRVEFVGFMPHDDVVKAIDDASFCVLPSYFETFSMAAVEVFARKKALIFTVRASGPELIEDGENGLLVDPDDVMQLAEKMEMLIVDSALRNRLAERGYEMCRNRFSTAVIVPQMEKYYQNVIQKCKK